MPNNRNISSCIAIIEEPRIIEEEQQDIIKTSARRNYNKLYTRSLNNRDNIAPSSSIVPNTQVILTELELITSAIKARKNTLITLFTPYIKSTPFNKLSRSYYLFTLCFPTLFPYSISNIN